LNLTFGAVLALIGSTVLMSTPALSRSERAYRATVAVGLVLVAIGLALWWTVA
jgi:fucose permease